MAFEAIKQLTNRVAKLDEGQILKAYVSNKKIQEFILNLNRVDQLFVDGIQSDGNPLTSGPVTNQTTPGVYSKYTEEINQGKSFVISRSGVRFLSPAPLISRDCTGLEGR